MDASEITDTLVKDLIPKIFPEHLAHRAAAEYELLHDDVDADRVTSRTDLTKIFDSMLLMDLVVAVEDKFNIFFEEEDFIIESFESVQALASIVCNKLILMTKPHVEEQGLPALKKRARD